MLRRCITRLPRTSSIQSSIISHKPIEVNNQIRHYQSHQYQGDRTQYNSEKQHSWFLTGAAVAIAGYTAFQFVWGADWKKVKEDIAEVLDDLDYDDGSYGPIFVRLAWHSAGTYSKEDNTGGSNGAGMRFDPESNHGANRGLEVARKRLDEVKKKHPDISYSDLWVLAAIVAIEEMGGPEIKFTPGRKDKLEKSQSTPHDRLPDASQGEKHIRDVFSRMGFNDQEMVALIGGGHVLGRCHRDRSGYHGPWGNSPTTFSNDFFVQLTQKKWTEKKWDGPKQFEDPTGDLMMLPTDMVLLTDPVFKKYVVRYAEDEELFFKDFASAFEKLMNLGFK